MADIEPGYTVLVKKTSELEVGQKLRLLGEATGKLKALIKPSEHMVTVKAIGDKSVDIGYTTVSVPARVDRGLKTKLYRSAKKRGRTAKKVDGGRRRTQRKH